MASLVALYVREDIHRESYLWAICGRCASGVSLEASCRIYMRFGKNVIDGEIREFKTTEEMRGARNRSSAG